MQNINRDTVHGNGATKTKKEKQQKRVVGTVRKQGQQTNVWWTDAQDQARNVSRTNLVLKQPVRGLQCRNRVVVHNKPSDL